MSKNKGDLSFLAILAACYMAVILRYQTVPKYILITTVTFAVIYFIWGVLHHLRANNFHARIVLEYLLVAILGVAIVSTLLL